MCEGVNESDICKYFMQGNCLYGASCSFLHSNTSKSKIDEVKSFSDVSSFTTCWYILENGWCPYGANCKYSHEIPKDWLKNSSSKSICVYYQRGTCRRGDECSFIHPRAGDVLDTDASGSHSLGQDYEPRFSFDKQKNKKNRRQQKQKVPCDELNDEDRRKHIVFIDKPVALINKKQPKVLKESFTVDQINSNINDVTKEMENLVVNYHETSISTTITPQQRQPAARSSTPLVLSQLTEVDLALLEQQERQLVVKRIEPARLKIIKNETTNNSEQYHILFASTDPDWGYDISNLPIIVDFPSLYPKVKAIVTVEDDGTLPAILIRHCALSLDAWLTAQHATFLASDRVWLCFRDLLRWLDRNLEELFTQGLKKYQKEIQAAEAGVQFFSAQELRENFNLNQQNETDEVDYESCDSFSGDSEKEDKNEDVETGGSLNPICRGTELSLRSLQFSEHIASFTLEQPHILLRCCRCGQPSDLSIPSDGLTVRRFSCSKCSTALAVRFRGALMHRSSSVAGYFDLTACTVEDLLLAECSFVLTCFSCGCAAYLCGLAPECLRTHICQTCHSRLELFFTGWRFIVLQASGFPLDVGAPSQNRRVRRKKQNDPLIREGYPLPDHGSCKHYRKSYRWLRFPCCGKAFPCDVCHDEASTLTGDHEMSFATRMICGHCAREQAYSSSRPCVACHRSLTQAGSAHWEGGRGCRDIRRMSNKDSHKHHSLNKTISRRAFAATATAKSGKS